MTSASMGRIGDYTLAGEDTSVHAKQVTRQCRRLQCVIRMLRKYGEQQLPAAQHSTLQQDQNCILAAKGFGTSYADWAHRKNLPALSLPFFDLHGVQQHFEAVQTFAEEGAKRHTSAKHRAWKDLLSKSFAVSGGRVAFRHIKNSFIPEISHVQTKQELDWVPVRRREKGPPCFRMKSPLPVDRKIVSDVGLVQLEQDGNYVFAIAEEGRTPSKFWAEGWAFAPEEVHQEFFAFWDKFWNAPDLHGGDDLFGMNLLTGFPDTLNAEITGFDVRQIAKCTKTNTSVGSDVMYQPHVAWQGCCYWRNTSKLTLSRALDLSRYVHWHTVCVPEP